jgi:hypothetical protein
MSDDLGGLLVAVAILGTFVVHVYYFIGAVYRRRGQFAVTVVGLFALYILGIIVSFFFGVGLCAAGCPRSLDFLLGLFCLGVSLAFVLWLRKLHRGLIHGSKATGTSQSPPDAIP